MRQSTAAHPAACGSGPAATHPKWLVVLALVACTPAWSIAAADATSGRATVADSDVVAVICDTALADTRRAASWNEARAMGRFQFANDVPSSAGTALGPREMHAGQGVLGALDYTLPMQVLGMVAFASMTIVNLIVLSLLGVTLWRRIRRRR